MRPKDFISTLQERTGITAVGPSALRRQGKGVLRAAQKFLSRIDLDRVPKTSRKKYRHWLDRQTDALMDSLPVKGRPWGAARKALNLFLRDVLYNRYLNKRYEISKIEAWLEVPLDSAVAKGLKRHAGRGNLPQWPGLKRLKPHVSDEFQDYACVQAAEQRIERIHLDIYLWLENR